MAITDREILGEIQRAVLETDDEGATFPNGFWTAAEVIQYLNNRQQQFIKETGVIVGLADITATGGTRQNTLPDDWMVTHRVVYVDSNSIKQPLDQDTSLAADLGIASWTTSGTEEPRIFIDGEGDTLTYELAPAQSANRELQITYGAKAGILDRTGDGTGLGEYFDVPDEFVPIIKYGTLADMFWKVGRGHDPGRATYCESRWDDGILATHHLLHGWM